MAFDGEVFFPKPSNDEQRRIVEKIRAASGVLVQGPPGTGKSHTIANLICHLLATGQRTLITAKTPRALQVLEGLIPDDLRPLCINLLGSGLEEKRSLETSVGGILRKNEEWNEYYAERNRMELEGRLHELRKEKAKVNRRLQDIRESETHTQSIAEGTYQGTAARIAEAVNRDRANYDWFTDSVSLGKTCPLSVSDLRSVLMALRQFTPERRRELGLAWPEALPPTEHFVNLVRKEAKVTEQENILAKGAEERIAACLSTSEVASIEGIHHALQAFRHECKKLFAMQKPWIREAVSDVSNGDISLWRDIADLPGDAHDLRDLLDSLRRYTPSIRDELHLSLPDILTSEDEIVNLFNSDNRAAEEKKRCLLDGADTNIVNYLVPKDIVCGSCRKPLDCQKVCKSSTETDTEQIITCLHCGNRNLVRPTTIQNSAQSIHDALSAFRSHLQQCLASNYSWMKDAVREIVGSNSAVWSERCRVTQQAIVSIERLVSVADETELDLSACANLSLNAVFEDVSNLYTYMENGGKLGWGPFRPKLVKDTIYLLKMVRVNGRYCSSISDLSRLADVLKVRLELNRAWTFWQGLHESPQGPYTLQLTTLKSLCNALENVLVLERLKNECRESMRQWTGIGEPLWHDESTIGKLMASCRLALVHHRQNVATNDLRRLESSAATWAHAQNAHPIKDHLIKAIRERDSESFVRCIQTVYEVKQHRQNMEKTDEYLREIAYITPRLAKELELKHNDPVWDERFCCIGDPALEQVLRLPNFIQSCRDALRMCPGVGDIIWNNESDVERHIASCVLALVRHEKENIVKDIREIEAPVAIIAARNNAHPVARELVQAIRDRNADGFEKAASKTRELTEDLHRLHDVDENLSELRHHIPQFVECLEQTCNEPYWEERILRIGDAWHWAQARYWIEDYIRQEDVPALAKRVKQIEDEINSAIARLASIHAWTYCFSRLQEDHRRHMEAWQQSMRRLGKGTGKHAPRHRREAQEHLNECREAVPAWVMPLHRVWDTVYPVPGMFDVIIVDEASQCGVEALPLFYLGKKVVIVGDDKQISPDAVGLPRDAVHRLMEEFLYDFQYKSSFDIESSLFDHGKLRYGTRRITLCEHFRCMPEIIRFSNDLCYSDTPLIPLRQYGPNRLPPLEHVFVSSGYREGSNNRTINRSESEAIVTRIVEMCGDNRYNGKTMGVVVLQGEAQATLIENQLLELLGAEEMERRRLVCGNSYSFQGDERDIMLLSLVAANNKRIGPLTKATDERRFNVAASRARDQMILFHSVTSDDLSASCLRRQLLDFFYNTKPQQISGIERDELERRAAYDNRSIVKPPLPFDSWFEVDVALDLLRKGFTVLTQHEVAGKRIDLVVEGGQARLAVECDGDNWHGADRYEADMQRQRQLERCGWEFFRVRESAFYSNKENALTGLWQALEERDIFPHTQCGNMSPKSDLEEEDLDDSEGGPTADDDSAYDDEGYLSDDPDSGFSPSGRRAEEITVAEIQDAILSALSKCPNQSCTEKSLTSRVLKEVGVLTRGNPRIEFEKRVMRSLVALEKRQLVEKYRAKNKRVCLV
ncbi:MAG TPA: AAA domain-containing protein [Candidatus Sumerlaeota bacterium]|nr:AAA domain-containing protein [Candidatus Sumerlaeota bacterium]